MNDNGTDIYNHAKHLCKFSSDSAKVIDKYLLMGGMVTVSDLTNNGYESKQANQIGLFLLKMTYNLYLWKEDTKDWIFNPHRKTIDLFQILNGFETRGLPYYYFKYYLELNDVFEVLGLEENVDLSHFFKVRYNLREYFLKIIFVSLLLGHTELASLIIRDPINGSIFSVISTFNSFHPDVLEEYKYINEKDEDFIKKFKILVRKLLFGYFDEGNLILRSKELQQKRNIFRNILPDYKTIDDLRKNDEIIICL